MTNLTVTEMVLHSMIMNLVISYLINHKFSRYSEIVLTRVKRTTLRSLKIDCIELESALYLSI